MTDYRFGTLDWWKNDYMFGSRGIVHAIANLVHDHAISPKKAVELMEALWNRESATEIPDAPWEEVVF